MCGCGTRRSGAAECAPFAVTLCVLRCQMDNSSTAFSWSLEWHKLYGQPPVASGIYTFLFFHRINYKSVESVKHNPT